MELNDFNSGVRRSTENQAQRKSRQSAIHSVLRGPTKLKTSGLYQDEISVESPPLWFYLKQKVIMVNLTSMLFIWIATCFNSYLIWYLLNYLQQEYANYVLTSLTALLGYTIGGFMFLKFGLKKSLGTCLVISIFGGVSSLLIGLQQQDNWVFLVLW